MSKTKNCGWVKEERETGGCGREVWVYECSEPEITKKELELKTIKKEAEIGSYISLQDEIDNFKAYGESIYESIAKNASSVELTKVKDKRFNIDSRYLTEIASSMQDILQYSPTVIKMYKEIVSEVIKFNLENEMKGYNLSKAVKLILENDKKLFDIDGNFRYFQRIIDNCFDTIEDNLYDIQNKEDISIQSFLKLYNILINPGFEEIKNLKIEDFSKIIDNCFEELKIINNL